MILNEMRTYECFSCSEEMVRDFILKNPKETVGMTISELSKETFSTPSTIVRFSQKLGFEGFSDFKIKLAMELNTVTIGDKKIAENLPINNNMEDSEIVEAILNLSYQSLLESYNSLDIRQLRRVANLICSADIISLWGQGPSLITAESFHYKLRRIGINSVLEPLLGFNRVYKRKSKVKEVALVVSNFANSAQVIDWINDLSEHCDFIVLLTANQNSSLISIVDEAIIVENMEEQYQKMGPFYSRTSMEFVLDCVYLMVFQNDYNKNVKQLEIEDFLFKDQ